MTGRTPFDSAVSLARSFAGLIPFDVPGPDDRNPFPEVTASGGAVVPAEGIAKAAKLDARLDSLVARTQPLGHLHGWWAVWITGSPGNGTHSDGRTLVAVVRDPTDVRAFNKKHGKRRITTTPLVPGDLFF